MSGRRPILAVVGQGDADLQSDVGKAAQEVGRLAVEAGFRIVTGGRGGVMAAASRGAHEASSYREGDVIGILPNYDGDGCNRWVDVAIRTGMSMARDIIIAGTADVLVAVGGGAGTLGELAAAWQLERPIVGLRIPCSDGEEGSAHLGWSGRLAGSPLDERHDTQIIAADTPAEAIERARELLERSAHGRESSARSFTPL